jgi:hypothetical protein
MGRERSELLVTGPNPRRTRAEPEPVSDAHARSQAVERHFRFLGQLGRQLRGDGAPRARVIEFPLSDQLPGLGELLSSLISASPTERAVGQRTVEEWNPFSQRILLADETPPDMTVFERPFALTSTYIQTFVEWSHEAVHIMVLEPFFCGVRPIRSAAEFVRWNLAGEGLAFWYADMVVTRTLRANLPRAELIYNRSAVSNSAFHPEQAFRQLGIRGERKILTIYADAFLGRRHGGSDATRIFPRLLAHDIARFYRSNRRPLANWYRVLNEFRFFDGYHARFCRRPGLPALWATGDLLAISRLPADQCAIEVGTRYLPSLRELSASQIERVALRRAAQTRAYFAWLLLEAVRKDWVGCLAGPADWPRVTASLERYLDELDRALSRLVDGATATVVRAVIARADNWYHRAVQVPFARRGAFLKYRYRLLPFFKPTGGLLGLADDRSGLTEREMLAVVHHIMARFAWAERAEAAPVVALLHRFLQTAQRGRPGSVRQRYNALLRRPEILPCWSMRPGAIEPNRNRFREPVFDYA